MQEGRRSFLKMLGIGAVAAPVAVMTVNEAQAEFAKKLSASFGNPFHIPADKIPKGMVYNWKRVFVTKDVPDLENLAMMTGAGWKPVPYTRHPELGRGTASGDVNPYRMWIEVGGLVLMERRANYFEHMYSDPKSKAMEDRFMYG